MKKHVLISIVSILMVLCSASSVLAKTVKEVAFLITPFHHYMKSPVLPVSII